MRCPADRLWASASILQCLPGGTRPRTFAAPGRSAQAGTEWGQPRDQVTTEGLYHHSLAPVNRVAPRPIMARDTINNKVWCSAHVSFLVTRHHSHTNGPEGIVIRPNDDNSDIEGRPVQQRPVLCPVCLRAALPSSFAATALPGGFVFALAAQLTWLQGARGQRRQRPETQKPGDTTRKPMSSNRRSGLSQRRQAQRTS